MIINREMIYREDDAIIFNTMEGTMIELNYSANLIISGISKGLTLEEIVQNLHSVYPESTYDELGTLCNEFVEQAKKAGVII